MKKLKTHQVWLAVVLANLALFLFAVQSWCRLMPPPSMADVRDLAEKAPLVFRGYVLSVTPVTSNTEPGTRVLSIAAIQVDRWYRGRGSTEVSLRFAYPNFAANGHDCIDFRPGTYWVVFAVERDGQLDMIDDCEGALTVSPLLGLDLGNKNWLAQMEADFLAGLNDHDPAARLASIQRLGGLKLPSSRDSLHHVIEKGDDAESKWAVYAALRTGDVTVLPRVKQLLANGDSELPEQAIAMQLQYVTDPTAMPDLVTILESAPSELTRTRVLIALGEKLKDPRAVPSLAAHLSDPDRYARYDSLDGLKNITHEDACTLPREWKEEDVEPQISRCRLWWEQAGKFRDWSKD
ncbi:MAG: HEAT repeat domain-containing protein [Candidatus Acidiferrum sp.]